MATATLPKVVSQEEWATARKELLAKEKAYMREGDRLAAERRALPMVEVEKDYVFEGENGPLGLVDLFEGRRQLIVYHFMFDPADPPAGKSAPWSEGCPGCSFLSDHWPRLEHLHAKDTTLVMVSRAPLAKILPFKKRMGWNVPWVSSYGTDFNYDFHVTLDLARGSTEYNYVDKRGKMERGEDPRQSGEQPGMSVFLRDGDTVYHTYSTYARGLEVIVGTYHLLDLTPAGRQEGWDDAKGKWTQDLSQWVKHHDRYGAETKACCGAK
jgi:predicted dithiol-disulfide oxidoreductase (DUF899 family)